MIVLLAVNGFLVYRFFSLKQPKPVISQPAAQDFSAGFTNPRYDHESNQSFFYVEVALTNIDDDSEFKHLLNCDTSERKGVGASIIDEGEESWTAQIVLNSPEEKVLSCLYNPRGVFEPQQTVKIVF